MIQADKRASPPRLLLRWCFIVLVGLLPLVMGVGLFRVLMNANLSDTTPVWSDEIYYWHQAATFRTAEFNGGYYTVNEHPATAEFARYYAWGMAVPAVYGVQARLLGWSLHAIPLMNMAVMCLAVMIFLWVIRAARWQILLTAVIIVTFVPFLLFSASSMLEVQQQAIAVLLAAAFFVLLCRADMPEKRLLRWQRCLIIGLIVLAALLRSTWALLFVPLCALSLKNRSVRNGLFALMAGGILFVVFGGFTQWMAAPYTNFIRRLLNTVRQSPGEALPLFVNHLIENTRLIFVGNWLEIAARLQILLLIVWIGLRWWRRRSPTSTRNKFLPAEAFFHLYNLSSIFVFNIVLYDMFDWRDYRVITPHLLMSLMLLVAFRRYWVTGTIIVTMCLLLPSLITTYRTPEWYGNHASQDRIARLHTWSAELAPVLQYQPEAESPWCNTLLYSSAYLFSNSERLLAVPPGLGLSVILDESQLHFPLKSRYVLLDNDFYQRHASQLHLEPLVTLPDGMLSINMDSACEG